MRTPTARRARVGFTAAALGAAAAILFSACSGSSAPQIAHAAQPASSTPSTLAARGAATSVAQTPLQKYLAGEQAFAHCVAGLGLTVNPPGRDGTVGIPSSVKLQLARNPHLSAQYRKCTDKLLQDPRVNPYPPNVGAAFTFEQKMATCFRLHGVPNYPDPIHDTDPSLPNVRHYQAIIHSLPTGTQTFQTALNTCSVLITGHTGTG